MSAGRLGTPRATIHTVPRQAAAEMADRKQSLRRSMRRKRATISPEAARAGARAAAERFAGLPETARVIAAGGMVAVYAAMRHEISADPIADALAERGVTLAYPRVVPGTRRLVFHRVADRGELRMGTFSILEPDASAPVAPVERIDLFVVPALAFDRAGNRLGWGAGHYDTTLNDNLEAPRVGLAYESQIVDHVPSGAHDLPMHVIVTDAAEYRGTR